MSDTAEERRLKIELINQRLRENIAEQALLNSRWKGNPPEDQQIILSQLRTEAESLKNQRAAIEEPGALVIWERVESMWGIVLGVEKQLGKLEDALEEIKAEQAAIREQVDTSLAAVTQQQADTVDLLSAWREEQVTRAERDTDERHRRQQQLNIWLGAISIVVLIELVLFILLAVQVF